MKKSLLLFSALVTLASIAHAQVSFFANAGTQFGKWRGNGLAILDTLIENSGDYLKQGNRTGYYIGVGATIAVGDFIEIEPSLSYSNTGTSLSKNLVFSILKNYGVNVGATVVTQRFDLPVLVKAEVAKGLYFIAGPQLNYAFSNQLKLKAGLFGINAINRKIPFNNRFEELSVAAVGGLAYRFPVGIQVQALYEYGATRIMHISNNVYQNNFRLGMTIPFRYRQREEDYY